MRAQLGPYLAASGVDADKFSYAMLQKIVNPGMLKKAELSAQQAAYVENAQVKAALAQAFDAVSAINKAQA